MTEIKPSFGVIVGRFQTHELTEGHLELFRNVMARHQRVLLFLGSTKIGPTRRNPLDFETRKAMIQEKFPTFTILPLQDKKTDEQWSRELDSRISDVVGFGDVTLYGSRDCFAPSYSGRHKVRELDLEITVPKTVSASEVRAEITNKVVASSDFRAGVIYAIGQLYPRCVTTVDIAIIHRSKISAELVKKFAPGLDGKPVDVSGSVASPDVEVTKVLLGRKPEEKAWRFIGGHAEPPQRTLDFEADAKKESMEETGLDISNVTYIGSTAVDDWRYRSEKYDGIKTIFFVAESTTMGGRGADDVAEVKWFDLDALTMADFEPEHQVLFEMLLHHFGKGK